MSSCDPTYRTDRQKTSSLHIPLSRTNSRRQISRSPSNDTEYDSPSDVKTSAKRNRSITKYSDPQMCTAILLLKAHVESYCQYDTPFLDINSPFRQTIETFWSEACMQVGIDGKIAFTDDIISQVRTNSLLNLPYLY